MIVGMHKTCTVEYYKSSKTEQVEFEQDGKSYISKYGVSVKHNDGGKESLSECMLFVNKNNNKDNIIKYNTFFDKEMLELQEKYIPNLYIGSPEQLYDVMARILQKELIEQITKDFFGRYED